jgi:hypothetical protein
MEAAERVPIFQPLAGCNKPQADPENSPGVRIPGVALNDVHIHRESYGGKNGYCQQYGAGAIASLVGYFHSSPNHGQHPISLIRWSIEQ